MPHFYCHLSPSKILTTQQLERGLKVKRYIRLSLKWGGTKIILSIERSVPTITELVLCFKSVVETYFGG